MLATSPAAAEASPGEKAGERGRGPPLPSRAVDDSDVLLLARQPLLDRRADLRARSAAYVCACAWVACVRVRVCFVFCEIVNYWGNQMTRSQCFVGEPDMCANQLQQDL